MFPAKTGISPTTLWNCESHHSVWLHHSQYVYEYIMQSLLFASASQGKRIETTRNAIGMRFVAGCDWPLFQNHWGLLLERLCDGRVADRFSIAATNLLTIVARVASSFKRVLSHSTPKQHVRRKWSQSFSQTNTTHTRTHTNHTRNNNCRFGVRRRISTTVPFKSNADVRAFSQFEMSHPNGSLGVLQRNLRRIITTRETKQKRTEARFKSRAVRQPII